MIRKARLIAAPRVLRQPAWLSLLLMCAWLGGCAAPTASPLTHSVRQAPGRSAGDAFDAAEAALVSLGYEIESRDPAEGVVRARPVAGKSGEPGVRTVAPGGSDKYRRWPQVRVEDSPGGPRVYCRVQVQEQATATYRMLAEDRRADDDPGATALERESNTTGERNTVWATIGRDTAAERAILTAILKKLGVAEPG